MSQQFLFFLQFFFQKQSQSRRHTTGVVLAANPAVTYAATEHQGCSFWITHKQLKLMRKAGSLQLIQNSAPSVAGWHQCCIRIDLNFGLDNWFEFMTYTCSNSKQVGKIYHFSVQWIHYCGYGECTGRKTG